MGGGSDRGGCGKCRENGNAGFVGTSSPSGRPIPVPEINRGGSQTSVIHRRLRQSFAQQLPGRVLCDHAVSHRYVSGSHEARIPPSRYRYPAHPVLCGVCRAGRGQPANYYGTRATKARGRYSTVLLGHRSAERGVLRHRDGDPCSAHSDGCSLTGMRHGGGVDGRGVWL